MSGSFEEGVAQIKAMGLDIEEEHIREALRNCGNNPEEAMQLLMPESPEQDAGRLGYNLVSTQTSTTSSGGYERDVDMRDTETHPGSGGDSDRDSTAVSYSLDEERNIEEEEEGEGEGEEEGETRDPLQFQVSNDDTIELSDIPPRPNGPPPRYEDIVVPGDQGEEPLSPAEDPLEEVVPPVTSTVTSGAPGVVAGSIEFPLTHFYELESRVHTDQWSIPYKRDESLAICMVQTTKMIKEG